MNFTSQMCTTKEQSERLLALELKKETADCFLEYVGKDNYGNNVWHPSTIVNNYRIPDYSRDIPAWSLHRLIEIYDKTCIFWSNSFDNPYDDMILRIEHKIKCRKLNKEYLN